VELLRVGLVQPCARPGRQSRKSRLRCDHAALRRRGVQRPAWRAPPSGSTSSAVRKISVNVTWKEHRSYDCLPRGAAIWASGTSPWPKRHEKIMITLTATDVYGADATAEVPADTALSAQWVTRLKIVVSRVRVPVSPSPKNLVIRHFVEEVGALEKRFFGPVRTSNGATGLIEETTISVRMQPPGPRPLLSRGSGSDPSGPLAKRTSAEPGARLDPRSAPTPARRSDLGDSDTEIRPRSAESGPLRRGRLLPALRCHVGHAGPPAPVCE
jgi:hypothetical protein